MTKIYILEINEINNLDYVGVNSAGDGVVNRHIER